MCVCKLIADVACNMATSENKQSELSDRLFARNSSRPAFAHLLRASLCQVLEFETRES